MFGGRKVRIYSDNIIAEYPHDRCVIAIWNIPIAFRIPLSGHAIMLIYTYMLYVINHYE